MGQKLANADQEATLLPDFIKRVRGPDLRLQAGYLLGVARRLGDDWLDGLLQDAVSASPPDHDLVVQVVYRSPASERRADLLLQLVDGGVISAESLGAFAHGQWLEALPLGSFKRLLSPAVASRAARRGAVVMLANRLKVHPQEIDALRDLAIALAGDPGAVSKNDNEEWHWGTIALLVADVAAPEIVRGLCELQLTDGYFLEHHSAAEDVLLKCAQLQPGQTWEVVAGYLEGPKRPRFLTGFPKAFAHRIPTGTLLGWVADVPHRARFLARVVLPTFSDDGGLASQLIERYGDDSGVGSAFFGGLISGAWSGPASDRWAGLARRMEEVAARTGLPRLRVWASQVGSALREMERKAQNAEGDQAIRWE